MNKTEIIANIADTADITRKQAEQAYDAFLESIMNALAEGDKVQLAGFGVFEVKERAARQGVNPRTGEAITVPACKTPSFRTGKSLKDAVNK